MHIASSGPTPPACYVCLQGEQSQPLSAPAWPGWAVLAAFILQETLAANVAVFLRAVGVRGEVSSLPVLMGQTRISEKHQPTTLQDPNQRTGSESECGIHRCRSGGCRSLRVSRVHHCAETVSPEPSGPVRVCSLVGNDRPLH